MIAVRWTVVGLLVAAGSASAQVFPLRIDTTSQRRPDASRLDPVVLTYIATIQPAGGVDSAHSLGERSVQLSRTTYAGVPAWEIVETHGAGANASVDTVIADFGSLSALHWGATQQLPTSGSMTVAARLSADFRSDSMLGGLTTASGRRNLVGAVPGNALLTAGQTETVLRTLPLGTGWRDSVPVVITDAARTSVIPASIAVTGEDHVLTTAGAYDCWVVVLGTESGQTQYWVSKADHIVVKTSQLIPESGELLQYTLTRISHTAPLTRSVKRHR
jgi:hypothetical protein